MICFCCPAMFNGLSSISGGISNQELASATNALLYACFAAFSLVAPAVVNFTGPRLALFVGGLGASPPQPLSLHTSQAQNSIEETPKSLKVKAPNQFTVQGISTTCWRCGHISTGVYHRVSYSRAGDGWECLLHFYGLRRARWSCLIRPWRYKCCSYGTTQ